MLFPLPKAPKSVGQQGAAAETILCGAGQNNQGLRLRVMQAQARGNDGPIQGPFVILDAGDNRHTDTLFPLVGQVTTAPEVLALLRQKHPACVNVVNAKILVPEPAAEPLAK